MKLIYCLLLIFCGSVFTSAQKTYTVEGTVHDFHDKTLLENAVIKIGNFTAKTNKKGQFSFDKIPAGKYTLIAQHPDCNDYTENIGVDKDVQLVITLEHHIKDIETVTIHGSHKNNGSLVVKTLNKSEIEKNSTDNLGNLLSKISGVTALKTGNNISKPVIHGLYGSRISILNNGVRLAEQEWGVEHAPNVDINNFQHIDVIKGASALKYGSDAIGGVVVMEPEIFPKKDTIKGSVGLTGISNGRGLGLDVDVAKVWKNGWAVKSGGNIKKLGDQSAPNYNLKNTGMDFSSFNFTVQNNTYERGISFDYYLTNQNIGILKDSHVSTSEDYDRAMKANPPIYSGKFSYDIDNPRQVIEHHIAKVSAFKRFENIGKISATYSYQYNHRQEYDIRRGELSDTPSLDLELMTHQFNLNDLLEREKWSLETGIDAAFQNNYSDPATKARRLIPNYDKYSAGAYSVFKYKISPEFNFEAGARYDFTRYDVTKWYDKSDWEKLYADAYPQFYVKTDQNRVLTRPQLNYNNVSFNAGLEYRPNANFDLKFNYAKVGRSPNVAELFSDGLHHSAGIIETGYMGLKNEQGHQFNLNVDSKFNVLKGLNVSVNPYFFITKNFINEIPVGIKGTIRGVFPEWVYQQIDTKMYGVDLDINWKLTEDLTYVGKGSYVYGQDDTHNEPLILMMPPNFSNALQFKKPKWNNFYFTVENQTFLKQTRFPIRNAPLELYVNGELVDKEIDFSTPPNGYSLWNIQTGINISKNLSAGLIVNNLFNTSYREYLNRLRFFADEAGRNFILNFRYRF
ncbi:iron complex outermembrane receptor protein [Chryseobacterium bernardetii]|uniref:Iron complex outermembrane receptor protein n=1 Tax=Chryseobacterium bernardetii TaxID=1241978 RepID=A0ACC6IQ14_9FLAO|nr:MULTISPECIES: TonB-dependent receptor [Chryseobacterium]MDR6369364.1 iron complex outermembrane receptor protein [Chryseobacterium vietnamense]MDR6439714.1 iron complex outermembrane receptor protein [Chryseobacterium bernardetii]